MSHKQALHDYLQELKDAFNQLSEKIKKLENEITAGSIEASTQDDPPGEGGNNPGGAPDLP